MNTVKSEDTPIYGPKTDFDSTIISKALTILEKRLKHPGVAMASPSTAKDFVRLKLAELEHEVFSVLWLDSQNRLIEYQEMFRGTLTQTSVYPREIVKAGLAINAGAVILVHNHPSGVAESSRADEILTDTLKKALALVDIKVLDHIVVGGLNTVSFAERGLV
jgi:DNA repair protein RadC